MIPLAGRRALVVGLAKSGVAAARALARHGAVVVGSDRRPPAELEKNVEALGELCVSLLLGDQGPWILEHGSSSGGDSSLRAGRRIQDGAGETLSPARAGQGPFDLIIKSPGVPPGIPLLVRARELGIPIYAEVELAFGLTRASIVAVTGTNGKTTTSSWIGEILAQGGKPSTVAGNIGVPLCDEVSALGPEQIVVAEISSFQLEDIEEFRPRVALLLNLSPAHEDRHPTWEHYVAAKRRLFRNQDPGDWAVLNAGDPAVTALAADLSGLAGEGSGAGNPAVAWFRRGAGEVPSGTWMHGDRLMLRRPGGEAEALLERPALRLPGEHNLENALAAACAAALCGVETAGIRDGLVSFRGVSHRQEPVGEARGVRFVNDSKATNPRSAITALRAVPGPVILLAGGLDRRADYDPMMEEARGRVKGIVIFGHAAELLEESARRTGVPGIIRTAGLEEAVRAAFRLAVPGDCILLSPGCASWDAFRDYEERGEAFRALARRLGEESA
ncbi:MAG: UDP-N-acetylmuramoyl-L-alanine--D-glutamate ligase [Firmicutes bacterium]|nr:UDP-N-acetylmuramoyl-L-alanine--D-glutamate ligase [Bacillota bacterium]